MRRTLPLRRAGLAGTAAVALLTGCGGADDSSASASSSSADFCAQAAALQNSLTSGPELGNPSEAGPAFSRAASQVRAIHPPAEISDDWNALADGLDQLARILTGTNLDDPQQAAAAQQQITQLQTALSSASTHVSGYLGSRCGLGDGTRGSSAPAS